MLIRFCNNTCFKMAKCFFVFLLRGRNLPSSTPFLNLTAKSDERVLKLQTAGIRTEATVANFQQLSEMTIKSTMNNRRRWGRVGDRP